MKFLQEKFFDKKGLVSHFLSSENHLLCLEKNTIISEEVKKEFVNQFINGLLSKDLINQDVLNSVTDLNAWSIDFPSWYGSFNEKNGKKVFVIGAEPHIHHKYLQTVYGCNSENLIDRYLEENGKAHPLFHFVSEIVAHQLKISKVEALKECYFTDLFPLSPFRGNGIAVGSADKLQNVIGNNANWKEIRNRYAAESLALELENVNPEIIITQGKDVFNEVKSILNIKAAHNKLAIKPEKGSRQFVRAVTWQNRLIISVPHIGSRRMRTFWNGNLDQVKECLSVLSEQNNLSVIVS